ncbi:MAG: apolipoprotein N-acyltransferase [Bacteroidetes bacterium]|nr:apolipoprotein N-acyltransferase [Bacteroidota bacterium]
MDASNLALNPRIYFFLSLISGVLMWLGWPPHGFPFILFVAFIPLLWIEDQIFNNKQRRSNGAVFRYAMIVFIVWNSLTTWWIYYASPVGVVFAVLANALFMSLVFLVFHLIKKHINRRLGYISLVLFWIAFEYLHLRWELAWPWLTLGNGFSGYPSIIQWYEYTGALGGTAWILIVNILIYKLLTNYEKYRSYLVALRYKPRLANFLASLFLGIIPVLLILVPSIISISTYMGYRDYGEQKNVLIIQPNIDPYSEKFDGLSSGEQLNILVDLSISELNNSTDYLIWPETSIVNEIWLNELDTDTTIKHLRSFLGSYPNLTLVSGFSPYLHYEDPMNTSVSARKYFDGECCYDVFNSALQMSATSEIQYYHKSRLVPGVERIPYPGVFKIFEKFTVNLGGISGSLGIQEEPSVFSSDDSLVIAPVICFESVFGAYLTRFTNLGAQAIFIITNDGWWHDTPGYKQHILYAIPRAIENRKNIARCANTGISCFISQRGDIIDPTDYWVRDTVSGSIYLNSHLTFYAKHGDYLGRVATFCSVLLILILIVSGLTKRFMHRR